MDEDTALLVGILFGLIVGTVLTLAFIVGTT